MHARPLAVILAIAAALVAPAHAAGGPHDLVVTALSVGPAGFASPYLRVTVEAVNTGGGSVDAQLHACVRATTPVGAALGREVCSWGNPHRLAPGARATFTRDFSGFCGQADLAPFCAGLTPMPADQYRVTVTMEPRAGDARPEDNRAAATFSYAPFVALP
ncbi:MAG TPA: hypothetical protein VM889_05950 [Candidatus Thermoplasmatota archaeon]|nr:hypothetical protein [Candidatus Thermoplasmatota archaeon]